MYLSKRIKVFTAVLLSVLMLITLAFPVQNADAAMVSGLKFVGNIIAGSVPSNFSTYWNQVTPENSTKWGSVESSQGSRNWSQADIAYNFARSNGYPFRFHTLVWGNQEPSWIGSLSQDQQRTAVENWIWAAGQKYSDSEFVDVVNEPLHAPASYRNAIGGSGATGWDWVVWSFEQARNAFPNSELCINDYGIISDPSAAAQYIQIINILNSRGLIDGIGIQCHHFNMDTVSVSTMNQVLNSLSATGLPIYVTELDITGDDNTQLSRYQEKFPVFWENPNVEGITLWGYIEGQTWRENTHLITSGGSERPALQWLRQYLAGGSPTPEPTPPDNRSAFDIIEAEEYNSTNSSTIQVVGTSNGGSGIGYIQSGNTVTFDNIDFGNGAVSFSALVATQQSTNIEVRLDSAYGTLLGTLSVSSTGDWNSYQEMSANVGNVTGVHDLVLVFSGAVNVDWITFTAGGSQPTPTPSPTPAPTPTPIPDTRSAFDRIEAEEYDATNSSTIQVVGTSNGGSGIGYIQSENTVTFDNIDFGDGAASFSALVATQQSTNIEIRLDSAYGTLLGTLSASSTGDWNTYQERSANIGNVTGVHDLVLVFSGAVNVDWFTFSTSGGNTGNKLVALTFDDGPNLTTTPLVLDKLEQYGVVASFFLIGQNINENVRSVMERQLSLGCEINNHSWSHSYMDQLSSWEIVQEIQQTNDIIYQMLGVTPQFFRPPYIAVNNTMYDAINLPFINGINCSDWDNSVSAQTRAQTILNNVSDGDIILLHDFEGNNNTVQALDAIIQGLLNDNYTLVTVSDLFELNSVNPNVEYKIWTNVND